MREIPSTPWQPFGFEVRDWLRKLRRYRRKVGWGQGESYIEEIPARESQSHSPKDEKKRGKSSLEVSYV
jgi:hypothetical protein